MHQQRKGEINCGLFTKWNTIQHFNEINYTSMYQHGEFSKTTLNEKQTAKVYEIIYVKCKDT